MMDQSIETIARHALPEDEAAVERVLKYMHTTRPTMAEVMLAISEFYDISEGELIGTIRDREVSFARQLFCYFAYKYAKASMTKIASFIKYRDHSTVHHALRITEKRVHTRPLVRDDVDVLYLRITEKVLERLRRAA